MLVEGDPTRDISATRNIRGVWIGGPRVLTPPPAGRDPSGEWTGMILVTAANGNQGRLLVPKLLAAGQPVRACVRSEASAERLRGLGVHEVVVGDISEPAVLARAIRGRGEGLPRRADSIHANAPWASPSSTRPGPRACGTWCSARCCTRSRPIWCSTRSSAISRAPALVGPGVHDPAAGELHAAPEAPARVRAGRV